MQERGCGRWTGNRKSIWSGLSVKQQCLLEVNKDKLELFSAEYVEGEEATPQPQAIDREKMWTQ